MGARFHASQEAEGHRDAKRRIVGAGGGQTVRSIISICRVATVGQTPCTGRLLRNRHSERWSGHENEPAAAAERVGGEYTAARERSDFDVAGVIAGQACALIQDIPQAGEILRRIVSEAEHLLPPRLGGVAEGCAVRQHGRGMEPGEVKRRSGAPLNAMLGTGIAVGGSYRPHDLSRSLRRRQMFTAAHPKASFLLGNFGHEVQSATLNTVSYTVWATVTLIPT